MFGVSGSFNIKDGVQGVSVLCDSAEGIVLDWLLFTVFGMPNVFDYIPTDNHN